MNHWIVRNLMFAVIALSAWPGAPFAREHRLTEALLQSSVSGTHLDSQKGKRVIEIRSYNLKPGTRDRFHQRFIQESLPLLQRFKVDVVAYGPSLHDADSYFLMRSYSSLEDRQRSEDSFYGSDEWKKGPREAVMADIESYTTVVVEVDDITLEGLRRLSQH
jgi:hypothetical protein